MRLLILLVCCFYLKCVFVRVIFLTLLRKWLPAVVRLSDTAEHKIHENFRPWKVMRQKLEENFFLKTHLSNYTFMTASTKTFPHVVLSVT